MPTKLCCSPKKIKHMHGPKSSDWIKKEKNTGSNLEPKSKKKNIQG